MADERRGSPPFVDKSRARIKEPTIVSLLTHLTFRVVLSSLSPLTTFASAVKQRKTVDNLNIAYLRMALLIVILAATYLEGLQVCSSFLRGSVTMETHTGILVDHGFRTCGTVNMIHLLSNKNNPNN